MQNKANSDYNKLSLTAICLSVIFATGISSVHAQSGADLFKGFLGQVMQLAEADKARKAWKSLSTETRACYTIVFRHRNISVDELARNGIGPHDSQLGDVVSFCQEFENLKLNSAAPCVINTPSNTTVTTICYRQFTVKEPQGIMRAVNLVEAIELKWSGQPVSLVEVETPQAKKDRHHAAERQTLFVRLEEIVNESVTLSEDAKRWFSAEINALRAMIQQSDNSTFQPALFDNKLTQLRGAIQRETELESLIVRLNQARQHAEQQASSVQSIAIASQLNELVEKHSNLSFKPKLETKPLSIPIGTVGPSYSCDRATSIPAKLICSDPTLRRLDLDLARAFYILRTLAVDERSTLENEARQSIENTSQRCRLKSRTLMKGTVANRDGIACIRQSLSRRKVALMERAHKFGDLDASEEYQRPIETHIQLQSALQMAGYLHPAAEIDGLYGPKTREAIRKLQTALSLRVSGFLSSATAEALSSQVQTRFVSEESNLLRQRLLSQATSLLSDYKQLTTKISDISAGQRDELALLDQVHQFERKFADFSSNGLVGTHIEDHIKQLLVAAKGARQKPVLDELRGLVHSFKLAELRIENSRLLSKALTEKNKVVVSGDAEDIIVFYNNTTKAPSVIRGLKGNVVFQNSNNSACQMGYFDFDKQEKFDILDHLKKWKQVIAAELPICDLDVLSRWDLFIVKRRVFKALAIQEKVTFLKLVDADDLVPLLSVKRESVVDKRKSDADRISEIQLMIDKGEDSNGRGIVAFEKLGSARICVAIDGESSGDRIAVERESTQIERYVGIPLSYTFMSQDSAFIAAKKGDCAGLYANGESLKTFFMAFERDNVPYRVLPIWITNVEVSDLIKKAKEKQGKKLAMELELKRKSQDQEELLRLSELRDRETKEHRQAVLRAKYGSRARAFSLQLETEMRGLVNENDKSSFLKYPSIESKLRSLREGGWEIMDLNAELDDFGVAKFKERFLEVGFLQSTLKLRNRILGEYQELCFITGFIADSEFGVDREPFSFECNDAKVAMQEYKASRSFESYWVVE